ncbi:MAG TPA: hypothetical protein DDZ11_10555, partial [Lentisphaeria bacterium]|nr:hypothetical protein [Lentisphaeria bacterium]
MRHWNLHLAGAARLCGDSLSLRKQELTLTGSIPELQKALSALPGFPDAGFERFRRSSAHAKVHLIAASAAMYDAGQPRGGNLAVLSCGREGSHEQNLAYYHDYMEFGRTLGRGHLFVGTIPTTAMCEAAILLEAHGPAYYLDTAGDLNKLLEEVELLLADDETIPAVLVFFPHAETIHAVVFQRGNTDLPETPGPEDLFEEAKRTARSVCVIPVYNNASTIREVVHRARAVLSEVLVVDDGSTDAVLRELLAEEDVEVIRHEHNLGKGAALRTALQILDKRGADFMITIDGDGQHAPEDMRRFLPLAERPGVLAVGCRDFTVPNVPDSSKFGRKFSNFWMKLETGLSVDDCQSGFRAYPVHLTAQLRCFSNHYNFETEILTRAAWAGLTIVNVPITTHYPPPEERISHFHPFRDNWRISLVHTMLVLRLLLPWPHRKLVRPPKTDFSFFKPSKLLPYLLKEHASPGGLAAAAAV